jgi:hypothetical protein
VYKINNFYEPDTWKKFFEGEALIFDGLAKKDGEVAVERDVE